MDENTTLTQLASAVVNRTNQLHQVSQRFYGDEITDEQTGEITRKPGVKLQFEEAIDEALLSIVDPFLSQGKRPPAEDVRAAMARAKVKEQQPDLHDEFHVLSGVIRRLERHIRNYSEAIRARQTVAKSERELAGHIPPQGRNQGF